MAKSANIIFFPWMTVPAEVRVGGFRMVPVKVAHLDKYIDPALAKGAMGAVRTHVDQGGLPVKSCTLLLRQRHPEPWDIPPNMRTAAWQAAEMLALGCMADERFMVPHFAPHMNATMFRGVGMKVSDDSDYLGLTYRRRGGNLRVGGRTYSETLFQQPAQIEGTECGPPNIKLIRALERARRDKSEVWGHIADSLDYFLLANGEMPDLTWESCGMLSAFAFDRLLKPAHSKARDLALRFGAEWTTNPVIVLAKGKRANKPDSNAQHAATQLSEPIHVKWMKELYELRSAQAHWDIRNDLSTNWTPEQHAVIAPFSYAVLVKLMLAKASYYQLTEADEVARDMFDRLLDSDWGNGWKQRPEWDSIISEEVAARGIHRVLMREFEKMEAKQRP